MAGRRTRWGRGGQTVVRRTLLAWLGRLASADAVAGFFASLGYDTSARKPLTAEAIGLAGESAAAIRSIELMSEDAEGFLRVVFVLVRRPPFWPCF